VGVERKTEAATSFSLGESRDARLGTIAYVFLTVAICTWNRAELLRQTLERMTLLTVPRDVTWELLVVNNNCTDATDSIVAGYTDRLPLRALWESTPGLSNARNAAVAAARGTYILWTDDDVLVNDDWLSTYASAFACYTDARVFGGPIKPWFADTPPRWLSESLHEVETAYAIRDFDFGDRELDNDLIPFGANMAFRTDALREVQFNPALGRTGTGMLGGEEEAVIRTLLQMGSQGRWVSGAEVQHYIPVERQNVDYLRRFYEGVGASRARMDGHMRGRLFLGRPRWVWTEFITTAMKYRLHRRFSPAPVWAQSLRRASMARGRFTGRVAS